MYSIVLLENIPQIGLQIWYLVQIGELNTIAMISMGLPLLSIIIVALIARVTEKQIINI